MSQPTPVTPKQANRAQAMPNPGTEVRAAVCAPTQTTQTTQTTKAAPATTLSRGGLTLRLQARLLEHPGLEAAATAVVTEMAQQLHCERVSVGLHHHLGGVQLTALSHGGDIQQQQTLVRCLAAAMHEAVDQRSVVVHPLPRNSAPGLTLAHAELARANGQLPICTVPITAQGRVVGAFLLERSAGIDIQTLEAAKDAASFVGPFLAMLQRLGQPLGGRLADTVLPPGQASGTKRGHRLRPFGLPLPVVVMASSLALAALLAFWPTTARVIAPARVEGAGVHVVSAPLDGFVGSVAVRPGQAVKAGQLLLQLEDKELGLERDKWAAERSQLEKLYREALTQDEASAIVIARSKLEQAQAQLDLVLRRLERTRLLAPMDGVVLSGDLQQAVGSPVKRGQELMTVGPDQRFRVVAEVDEQDIGQLRLGQHTQVMFGAFSGQRLDLTVTRIAPVATALEQGNVFEVEGTVQPDQAQALRSGMRGVARIDIERSTVGAVWWRRAQQWAQRTWWRVLG